MSQPQVGNPSVSRPGDLDTELGEFWAGDPWSIFRFQNLSAFERNRLFLNAGNGRFLDASHESGADSDGDGRAVVALDMNHDGMLDLVVRQAGGGPLLAYENRMTPRSYVDVTLRGTKSNCLGVGARLTAHVSGAGGDRALVREHYPFDTYRSQAPLVTHFGLGDAVQIDRLDIAWPSGVVQTLTDLPAGQEIVITEGSPDVIVAAPGTVIGPAD